ncbi:MAG: Ig-like domain-containing protein [Gemmatimonadota bacterium]|nr:Ig-like domain-containing protein [Gemmatimonadota bacterium]
MFRVLLTLLLLATGPGQAARGAVPGSPFGPAPPQNQAPQTVDYIDVGTLYVGGSSATVNASSYFSDPNGDTLTYSVNNPSPSIATVSITGSTVTIAPVAVGNTSKIVVTAEDPGGLTATQDFNVTVENTPPPNRAPTSVGYISDVTLQVGGSSATRSVSGKFSDPDGDTLTYSVNDPDTSTVTVSISGSTVTIAPVAAGTTGKIVVTATDPGGLTATQDFNATVENPPPSQPNRAPTAVGSISDVTLQVGGSSATRSVSGKFSDPDGDTLTYSVNDPDTSTVTVSISGSTVTIAPVAAGTTGKIVVTAKDPGGLTATQDFTATVENPPPPPSQPNRAPTAAGSIGDRTLTVGGNSSTVNVSSYFSDPDDDTLTYSVNSPTPTIARVRISGSTMTMTPVSAGTTAKVIVTAEDPGGLSATQDFNIKVNGPPVVSGSIAHRTVDVGNSTFTVNVSGKFSDPNSDILTFSASSSNKAAATVSESSGTLTVTPKTGGTTTITVTATDSGGLSASLSFTVKVNRKPAKRGSLSNRTVDVGDSAFRVPVSGKFSDPDGDDLNFSATSSDTSVATVSESSGTLTVTPKAGGTTTITVTASDGRLSASLTFTVKVNRGPTTSGSLTNRTVNVGTSAFDIPVSGKFSDPDGDDLTYSASSADTSAATVSISSGTLTITPKTGGSTTITVTASDGRLTASLTFTVTVSVSGTENQSPTVSWTIPDQPLERNGSANSVILSSKFSDPDNDVLTYSASSSDTSAVKVSVSGSILKITPGMNGTSTVTVVATDPGGLTASQTLKATVSRAPLTNGAIPKMELGESDLTRSIDVASYFSDPDGEALTYAAVSSNRDIATASATGSTVTVSRVSPGAGLVWVTATDPGGLTVVQYMTIQVTNRPPESETSIENQTLYLTDAFRRVDLTDKFSDPDGQVLAYTATSSDTDIATVAAGGSTLRIRPVARGATTVTLRATDPGRLYVEQSFTATVANQYPQTVEPAIGDQTLYLLGGRQTIDATLYFSDPDGDRLSYAVSSPNPEIVTVSIADGKITLVPVALGSTGKILVTARDAGGLATNQDFTVTVMAGSPPTPTNRVPVASGTITVDTLYAEGPSATIDVASYFSDPDTTDVLSFTVASRDPGIVIVSISGSSVKITPKGPGNTGKIAVTARDPGGLTATQDFNVTVVAGAPPVPPNRNPIAVGSITVDTLYAEGPSIKIDVTSYFSDPDADILTYSVNSPNPGVVEVTKIGNEVTLRPVAAGSTGKIVVTARDPGRLTAVQDFDVIVVAGSPPPPTNNAPEIRENLTDLFITIGGGTVSLNVAPYFEDPDGDSLSYQLDAQGTGRATLTIADSTLSIEPLVLGTTGKNLLRAVDPAGLFVQQDFVVHVVTNLAPDTLMAIPDDTLTVAEGSVKLDLSAFFFDPDQDTLMYSAVSSNVNAATVSVSSDTLTISPVKKHLSSTVTVTATDGDLSVAQDFDVTVANSPPEVSESITGRELTVATGPVKLGLSAHFRDADGDDLSFNASSLNTGAAIVSVTDDSLTIAPVEKDMSSIVTVNASDGKLEVELGFEVTVANSPPEVSESITGRELTVATGQVKLDLSGHFRDADGDTLSYAAESSDTSAVTVSVSDDSLAVKPRAAGSSTVKVTASDDDRATVTQSFLVTVGDGPPPRFCPAAVAEAPIPNQTLIVGAGTTEIDLTQHFEHIDQDGIEITVTSPSPGIATAAIEGTSLKIDPVAAGQIDSVTVTISDTAEIDVCDAVSLSFMVTVKTTVETTVVSPGLYPWSVSGERVYRLTGNVSIGVEVPDQKLVVDGTVKAEGYRLRMIPADYVFEEGYDLLSLDEVASYIRKHGHLPGVTSGAEMKANGLGISQMQTVLLEKIEELSLYIIAQHEQLRVQGEHIVSQQQKLEIRKKQVSELEQRLWRLER